MKCNRDRKRFIYNDNITKKPFILKTIVKKFTEQIAMMFSILTVSNLILFYIIIQIQKLFFIGKKIERLFVPKFYHDRNTVNFLKELQFVDEFDTTDKIRLSEIPAVFGRKLYEYRTKTRGTSNKFIEAKDNDWPFPDI